MRNAFLIFILATVFIIGCVQPQTNSNPAPSIISPPIIATPAPTQTIQPPSVCFSEKCLHVQLARTEAEKERGLMGVTSLSKTEGMLFAWDAEGNYPFWMKDTLIPLDMIWINSQNKVVDITTMQPCAADPCPIYTPRGNAQYVLETKEGLMQDWQTHIGDTVAILHT